MMSEQLKTAVEKPLVVWADAPKPGSLKSLHDISAFVFWEMEKLLSESGVVILPRGTIDRRSVDLQNLTRVPNDPVNGFPHVHERVILIPAEQVSANTFVTTQSASIDAIRDALQQKKYRDFFWKTTTGGTSKNSVLEELNDSSNRKKRTPGELITRAEALFRHNEMHPNGWAFKQVDPYEILRDIQTSIPSSEIGYIPWEDADMAIIETYIPHGRSVIKTNERQPDERPYFLDTNKVRHQEY